MTDTKADWLSPKEQQQALKILFDLSVERTDWRRWVLGRWVFHKSARLRAGHFLERVGYRASYGLGTKNVAEPDFDD